MRDHASDQGLQRLTCAVRQRARAVQPEEEKTE